METLIWQAKFTLCLLVACGCFACLLTSLLLFFVVDCLFDCFCCFVVVCLVHLESPKKPCCILSSNMYANTWFLEPLAFVEGKWEPLLDHQTTRLQTTNRGEADSFRNVAQHVGQLASRPKETTKISWRDADIGVLVG